MSWVRFCFFFVYLFIFVLEFSFNYKYCVFGKSLCTYIFINIKKIIKIIKKVLGDFPNTLYGRILFHSYNITLKRVSAFVCWKQYFSLSYLKHI